MSSVNFHQVLATDILKSPMVINLISIILVKPFTTLLKKSFNILFYLILIIISVEYLFSTLAVTLFDEKGLDLTDYSYVYGVFNSVANFVNLDSNCTLFIDCQLKNLIEFHPFITTVLYSNNSQITQFNCESLAESCNFEKLYLKSLEKFFKHLQMI